MDKICVLYTKLTRAILLLIKICNHEFFSTLFNIQFCILHLNPSYLIIVFYSNSVARGRVGAIVPPTHWHAEYIKYPVFCPFETNFGTKSENSLSFGIGNKNGLKTAFNPN